MSLPKDWTYWFCLSGGFKEVVMIFYGTHDSGSHRLAFKATSF